MTEYMRPSEKIAGLLDELEQVAQDVVMLEATIAGKMLAEDKLDEIGAAGLAVENIQLEEENEALWMYYKANCNSDFDLFKEAEKRLKALGGDRKESSVVANDGAE